VLTKSSIFIVPRSSNSWRGNEAGWITASGWAAAGQQLWGEALVATTDGVFTPQQSMLFPRGNIGITAKSKRLEALRGFIPEYLITAYKDWRLWQSKKVHWPIEDESWLAEKQMMMVWERHDLFPGPGRRLATRLKVPLVISVEALAVWEAEKWGVKRPLWGMWLERNMEAKSLISADLVSCVSDKVKEKVIEMGIAPDKVIVSPNRVDSMVFNPHVDGQSVARQYNLNGKRVIGWTGSFRSFHGLNTVIMAFKKVYNQFSDVVLMLVGDGQEFEKCKKLTAELGLNDAVIFPGRQPFTMIPQFVVNFYVGLVSASSAEGFHYSPLKLREYLATGCTVIAPRAGDLPELFSDGNDLLFYNAGNSDDLAEKIGALLENTTLRNSLIKRANDWFEKEGTWVHELRGVCSRLNINTSS
jgi:glycosyltransferase involved in cell wall biosynthesis